MIKNKKLFEIINKMQDEHPLAEATYFKRNKNNTVDLTVMYKSDDCQDFALYLKTRLHPLRIDISMVQYAGQEKAHMKFELYDLFTDEYDHELER